jgi:cysteine desulfurase
LAVDEQGKEFNRVHRLHTYMITHLKKIQRVRFNGSLKIDSYKKTERIPSNINLCKEGLDAEYAVLRLDAKGVAVSSVTSCRSKNEDSSSYVVEELSDIDCGKSSLRITIGRFTSLSDIKKALEILKKVLV